jgi:hypothetical protein
MEEPITPDVQVIARAAGILEARGQHSGGLSLSKTSGLTDLSGSTAPVSVRTRTTAPPDASHSNFQLDVHPFRVDLNHEFRERFTSSRDMKESPLGGPGSVLKCH